MKVNDYLLAVLIVAIAGAAQTAAQRNSPAFDIVSIKASGPDSFGYFTPTPDGFRAGKTTPRLLIATAFRIQDYQLSGGPSWISSEEFDFVGKADRAVSRDELLAMLQDLLTEHFGLLIHKEQGALSGYLLTAAKGGAKLGVATGTAAHITRGRHKIEAQHVGIGSLIAIIGAIVERPIVDKTGLRDAYDFTLEWSEDDKSALSPGGVPVASQGPTIFTALQEQLGLKLEPAPAVGDLYVIDRIRHPAEN